MIAHPSQKTALWLLIIISFFCIPFNALSEVFSPDNLSPESLREDLQIIAGDEDISWITENNLPFVHTPNSHLHSLLVDYAIIREINSQGLPHNLISMTNRGYLEGYLQLYNNVGEGIKLYMGDIYIDHLEENTTSSLLDYLKEKSANWIGNQIENSLTGTQSNLVSYGWGKYNTIDAIANAFIESSNSNSLEFIESLWNLTATLTGSSAAGVGAYMNFLFSTIDMFEEEATKNRIRLYAALSYKSETINDFTRHYYQPNNDIETYTLYTYSPIYTFLNQPQLESNYFDNIGEEIAYQEIVSNHLSAYGLNNYTLQQDAIQDILLFIGPSFVSFIDKYRAMLDEASAASWAELETELYDLIHAEVQRANYIRYNYSYRGDDIDKKSVLLAYNGTDTFYLLNNSSERLHNTYLLDTDWIHEDTNHKNIAPEEYTFFQVEKDNLPEELHYTLFNVPDQFQLTTDDFKNFFAQINISAEKYITYSDIHFSSKNNAFAYPEEVTFHWDFGDGETASGGSATHQYKNPGDYIVTLSLIRNGQPYKVTKEVRYIKPNDATIPTDPTIEASPDDHYTISDTITLTATSTSVDSESTIEYYWYTKNTEDQNAWFHVGSTLEVQPTDPDKETYYARAENIHGSSSLASVTLHNNGFYSVGDSVIEPYQDENGNWINTFNICGAIGGNTTLKGGTLDLAGCILVIDGDLIQSGGILNVNGGKLIVKGDYRIQGETSNGNTYFSDGKLNMSNEADYILVEENFIMDSSYQHDGGTTNALLYAGTLEVRGNFTQKSSDPSTFYSPYENFEARGTHKVLLSGTGPQTVSFEDAAPSYSHFNILEITNPDPTQITFNPAEPTTSTIIYDAPPLSLRDLNIGEVGLTLPMDLKIVLSEGASFELSNQVLNLNGHTLTVEGDFIHSGGTLNVNGGKLIVKGDYRIQNKTADGAYTYSTGKLNMVNEADHILVEGDFVMDSSYQHDGGTTNAQLYAGTLELKGNFTQKSTDTEGFFPYENFEARGTHKVLLSGSGPQSVSFEDAAPSYSHFNILEITNSDPTQIAFKPGEPTTSNIVYNANSIPLRDLYIGKVGLTLPMDMNIVLSEGRTFKLYNQVLNLNGHTLTVEGDFIHSGGTLNVNGGKLIVKGDYRIQNKTADGAYTYSTGKLNMANEADHILVEGDFVMDSMYQHDGGTTEALLYAGTLEVRKLPNNQRRVELLPFENFEARGTHKVLLSGTGPQAISFEDLRPLFTF
ncbi:MAG: PKD domain-containing protein [Candidatus Electrothrix sp. Rat3]|nr:PKD domain-containing protein [Candidatus Electrothrix rattekaaiensis]